MQTGVGAFGLMVLLMVRCIGEGLLTPFISIANEGEILQGLETVSSLFNVTDFFKGFLITVCDDTFLVTCPSMQTLIFI